MNTEAEDRVERGRAAANDLYIALEGLTTSKIEDWRRRGLSEQDICTTLLTVAGAICGSLFARGACFIDPVNAPEFVKREGGTMLREIEKHALKRMSAVVETTH